MIDVKERPIIFNPSGVKAILEGRKTATRRAISKKYGDIEKVIESSLIRGEFHFIRKNGQNCYEICPYGHLGDRLWVRETWRRSNNDFADGIMYKASNLCRWFDDTDLTAQELAQSLPRDGKWKPSIFMPRWDSRILLEIIDVSIARLQDISEDDAESEGVDCDDIDQELVLDMANKLNQPIEDNRPWFAALWEAINGKDKSKCWDANPWVWVIEFKRIN